MKTALIIGGGFAGCAMADQFRLRGGWDVTLVERGPMLGAGVRTQWYGGHPYTFGPRHFLSPHSHVFEYLSGYVPMRRIAENEFLTYVADDSAFYGYPIHHDDIPKMPEAVPIMRDLAALSLVADRQPPKPRDFEAFWIASIGQTLYRKFVKSYSEKMWMLGDNREIDDFSWSPKGVTIKRGPRAAWDTAISAYPIAFNGYDDFFRLATRDAVNYRNVAIDAFDIPKKTVWFNNAAVKYDVIVNTISPDLLFEKCHGELPYVGRDLQVIVLPVEFALPENVYFTYYAGKEPYTRVTEYKKFTQHKSPHTLITIETPSLNNKHYPLPMKRWQFVAQKYFDEMPDGVFSIGRAGSYRYNVDIDDTILHAMDTITKIV